MVTIQQWWKLLAKGESIIFINSKILNKEKTCEQVVFIRGFKNGELIIEMAGGEFCGNAVRAVAYYMNKKYNIKSLKIRYKNYKFNMIAKCYNDISLFKVNRCVLIKNCKKVGTGVTKVQMYGITHYLITENSKLFVFKNDRTQTTKMINNFINENKSIGIMYLTRNFELTPYVYVRNVNTLLLETACGSGTIACGMVYENINSKIIVKQPSGYTLQVNFIGGNVILSGKCKILKEGYVLV